MEDTQPKLVARFRALSPARRGLLLGVCLLSALFLLVLLTANLNMPPRNPSNPVTRNTETLSQRAYSPGDLRSLGPKLAMTPAPPASVAGAYRGGRGDVDTATGEPRIAYSAELSVATKEFTRSRATLEEILERHRGYVAKLRMVGQPAGSLLSATLRIPSSEYSSALSDLKSIGHVEHEEESADEITQQHGDLEARLVNAQNTEQRLQKMLQNSSLKQNDAAMFRSQLATLQAEIQRLQAERQAFDNRAVFSSVFFSIREEVTPPAVTLIAQLRAATSNGLSDAASSLSAILVFAMNYGPSFLLWSVILYLPARFVWRRSRLLFARTAV
jgi:uncharacterized small protein (DUF1192 family)